MNKRIRKKSLHATYIIIFLAAIFSLSLFLQDYFKNIQDFLSAYTNQNPILVPLLFVLFAALSVMLGPFTSAPLISFAVALWDTSFTLFFLLSGWLIGNTLAYLIGKHIGHPIVKRLVKKEKLLKWETFLSEKIDIRLVFLFRLAAPSEVGYVFGIMRYNLMRYLTITILAEIPLALLLVFAGEAIIGNNWELFVGLTIAGLTVILSSLYLLKSLETKRKKDSTTSST